MEKFKVSFEANNQQLKALGTKHASDTYADIEATFVLGEKWTDMDSVSAVWWNDFVRVATVLDSQGKCTVPHEVLTRKGCVRVNLVGSIVENDELVTRLTSYSAEAVQVNEKIKLTGNETSEITPSQYEQFVAQVIAEVEKVTGMTATAETLPAGSDATARYENGVLYLGIPQGIQGETGNGIDHVVLNSDYTLTLYFTDGTSYKTTSIRGDKGDKGDRGERGETGNGIENAVLNDDYTLTLTFTDGTTYTTPSIRGDTGEKGDKGDKGDTGATPNISIGTVTTVDPDAEASATITGTPEDPVLNLEIPQGKTGEVSYEDLTTLLPRDTASGDIVTIPDGQSVIPAESLKVALEPIQDLHGYDKPWSGGAGKNKLPISCDTETKGGVTYTVYKNSSGAVTRIHAEGTSTFAHSFSVVQGRSASNPFTIKAGSYWFKGLSNGVAGSFDFNIRKAGGTTDTVQITGKVPLVLEEDTDFQSCYMYVYRGGIAINADIYPMAWLQSEASDDFAPYSNICPISGRTEVVTQRTGKNLLDKANGSASDSNWWIGASGKATGANGSFVLPSGSYTFSSSVTVNGLYVIDESNTNIRVVYNNTKATFTLTTSKAVKLMLYKSSFGTSDWADVNIQLELGSTASAYEPYQGNTHTTDLGQTVYGGTLDVVSGELSIEYELEVFDTIDASGALISQINSFSASSSSVSTIGDYTRISFAVRGVDQSKYNRVSSTYSVKMCNIAPHEFSYNDQSTHWYRNTVLYLLLPTSLVGSTAQSVFDYLVSIKDTNPLTFAIPLANPQTYQLTPQEVRLLLGTNNIWSDGKVTLTYNADIQRYIEKKLNGNSTTLTMSRPMTAEMNETETETEETE